MSKRIPELDVGTMGIGSLFETAEVDGTSSTGYNSTKVSASDIGNFIANVMKYSGLDNKTIIQAILDASGGGTANMTELTQAEYDALEQAGQLQEDVMYFITDGQSPVSTDIIDDTTTAADKVWSSDKTDDEIQAVASDLSDLSSVVGGKQTNLEGGSLSNVDLDTLTQTKNYWVSTTSITNAPVNQYGYLEVIRVQTASTSFLCFQRYSVYGNNEATYRGDIYERFYANGQWYDWNKITTLVTPANISVTRTNLTQNSGIAKWAFAVPVVSGYTRMIIGANSSNSLALYVRSEENGNNMDVYINNTSGSSVTYDMTIVVCYIKN